MRKICQVEVCVTARLYAGILVSRTNATSSSLVVLIIFSVDVVIDPDLLTCSIIGLLRKAFDHYSISDATCSVHSQ